MSKNILCKKLQTVIERDPPDYPAVLEILNQSGPIAREVADVLRGGLTAQKSVVTDGEIFSVDDHPTRHKYAETILKLLGELDGEKQPEETHYHFTAIQLSEKSEDDLLSTLMGRTNAIAQRKPDSTGNNPAGVREDKNAA